MNYGQALLCEPVALNVFTIYIKRRLTEIQFCSANTPPKRGVRRWRGDTSTQGPRQHDTPSMDGCDFWMLLRGGRWRANPGSAASET
ncbi:hypothetical protein CBM2586_B40067 [Cupriavidus phytorum]|uniref:Uncharacterized protein n=1 Tax=Cupriavidus taiwanensis TaxID=164546 RepID=A0A975XMT1_9BURK|nr:hypothetical protein CBM2586_B40067 [Cupriavidus taiwanensis]